MSDTTFSLNLKIWRQESADKPGKMVDYKIDCVDEHMSFLEMLDVLNQQLIEKGEVPVAFDHDCREGICGTCGCMINGHAHGKDSETTLCQLHMRKFRDGDTLYLEPWRAKAFPIVQDLCVDRSAFDRIQAAGAYCSVHTGSAIDGNSLLVPKANAESAMDAAACIGCGACVAACKNASAMLFVGAKVSQFALLPQGQIERKERVLNMVEQMDAEGFGNCTNEFECEAACPKGISVDNIARMNREYIKAAATKAD